MQGFVNEILPIVIAEHIRYTRVHGRIIILNLFSGEYSILNETATFLWDLVLSSPSFSGATTAFAEKFGIDSLCSQNDLRVFIDDCISRHLLTTESDSARVEVPTHWVNRSMTLLSAWWCLLTVKRSLRILGFSETYKENMGLKYSGMRLTCERDTRLTNSLKVFRLAENGFGVRTADIDCLPQSLALHRFLLAGGFKVNHCIGVRRFPFGAHAWVELNGKPIYDSVGFVKKFTPISKIPSCHVS